MLLVDLVQPYRIRLIVPFSAAIVSVLAPHDVADLAKICDVARYTTQKNDLATIAKIF